MFYLSKKTVSSEFDFSNKTQLRTNSHSNKFLFRQVTAFDILNKSQLRAKWHSNNCLFRQTNHLLWFWLFEQNPVKANSQSHIFFRQGSHLLWIWLFEQKPNKGKFTFDQFVLDKAAISSKFDFSNKNPIKANSHLTSLC